MKTILSLFVLLFVFSCCGTESNGSKDNQNIPLDGRGGGLIAFQSERNGPNEQIYIMNADGTAQTRLTNNTGDV